MHDFFDKLGAAARRAAGNVANEVSVAAQKQKLSDCYKDLGKRCYQAVKNGESLDFAAEIAKIDEVLAQIDALKDRRDVTSVTVEVQPEDIPVPAAEEVPQAEPTADEPDFVIVEE